ncbi:MAG: hypothetical protein F6K40_00465 [Okeania sp. SIO3I5]|nr:hypothetical protein [Okeania sp. SIO3I5]
MEAKIKEKAKLQDLSIEKYIEILIEKEIESIVSEVDETAYLFKSEANKNRLLNAVENVEHQTNLIELSLEEIE